MCLLCLSDFQFVYPEKTPLLEKKKGRVKRIKQLLTGAETLMSINHEICESKVAELKEEQYKLSQEF
jgi:hypothetical protein